MRQSNFLYILKAKRIKNIFQAKRFSNCLLSYYKMLPSVVASNLNMVLLSYKRDKSLFAFWHGLKFKVIGRRIQMALTELILDWTGTRLELCQSSLNTNQQTGQYLEAATLIQTDLFRKIFKIRNAVFSELPWKYKHEVYFTINFHMSKIF